MTLTMARPLAALGSAMQMTILHAAKAAGLAGCLTLTTDGRGAAVTLGRGTCTFTGTPNGGLNAVVADPSSGTIWEASTPEAGEPRELARTALDRLRASVQGGGRAGTA